HFGPGSHATTFGGNPLAMAAAKAVLQHVFDPAFLQTVEEKSIYLKRRLQEEIGETRFVTNIKGKGLMIGIECAAEVTQFIPQLMEKGLLVLNAGPHVLRLLPPLTVGYQDIDKAVALISEVMKNPVTMYRGVYKKSVCSRLASGTKYLKCEVNTCVFCTDRSSLRTHPYRY